MSRYIITGGGRISGEARVQGAKNAALPIMAACVLNSGESVLHNVPDIADVRVMVEILESIGCRVSRDGGTLTVDSSGLNSNTVSESLVSQMRSSIMIMGALLAKQREVRFFYPGGCDIGLRPVDMHMKGFRDLGAVIKEEQGYIVARGSDLKSGNVALNYPSVGATENLILASVFSKGVTSVANAAKEPEIYDLQQFLNAMGAKVYGVGTNTVHIEGVESLHGVEYTIMPDRIVTGTLLCGLHMAGGEMFLRGASLDTLRVAHIKLQESGLRTRSSHDGVHAESDGVIRPIDMIETHPYPGFPTDLQSPFVAMLCAASGTSLVKETVFESRYRFTNQLARMGADITIDSRIAVIRGVDTLSGANVRAEDLRGGAALILAGLRAEGTTVVEDAQHVDRGYENLDGVLKNLGCGVVREP